MKKLDVLNFAFKGFLLSAFCFAFADIWFLNLFYAQNPDVRSIWSKVTYLGDSEWMLIGALTCFIGFYICSKFTAQPKKWVRYSHKSLFTFASVAITGITAALVKNSIGRARPYLIETEGPYGFNVFAFDSQYASWPSGHSTTAFAFATAMAILFPRLTPVFYFIACIAAASRGVIGAHYLSDIVMGATLGTVGTVLIYRWLRTRLRLGAKRRRPQNARA